jgi:DNA-binding LacI/PurR family transcriptional regulator
MSKRVTLREVAAKAGVSYQTVSKVLNKQAQVAPETETRILETVRELGYRPNLLARSMRAQRSYLIGYPLLLPNPDQCNPILERFLARMVRAAEDVGYHLLCFPDDADQGYTVATYLDLIDTNRVDGFILSNVDYDDPRVQLFWKKDFPFVAFGRSNPDWDFPYVDVDGAAGMQMAVEHLISLGHRRIATLAWPENSRVGNDRMQGYLAALNQAEIHPREEWIQRGDGCFEFGFQATTRLLDQNIETRPTAIVAFDDTLAVGAMRAIQYQGLLVGRDIAITGFDDSPMIKYLSPSLTSVSQPIKEVGKKAISILINILNETPVENAHFLIKPELHIRESSGGPVNNNHTTQSSHDQKS